MVRRCIAQGIRRLSVTELKIVTLAYHEFWDGQQKREYAWHTRKLYADDGGQGFKDKSFLFLRLNSWMK